MKKGDDVFRVGIYVPDDESPEDKIEIDCDKHVITCIRKGKYCDWITVFLHLYTDWNTSKGKVVTAKSALWMKTRVLLTKESDTIFNSSWCFGTTKLAAYKRALSDFKKEGKYYGTEAQRKKVITRLKSAITRNSKKKTNARN